MKELSEEEALYKAAAYCSVAEHCLAEVVEKLMQWGVPAEGRERIMKRLVAEKYIDENRYCRAFIHDKLHYNKWGRVKIAQALRLKGIDSACYAPLLEEVDEDAYRSVLLALIDAKRKSVKGRNDYERNGKLIRFALGRGFEMSEIKRCLVMADEDEWMDE